MKWQSVLGVAADIVLLPKCQKCSRNMNKYIQSITDLLAMAHISDMGRKPDPHSIPRVAATIIAELVNDAAAYKKQVDTLQRELDKVQDEINWTESGLEAFRCEFEEEVFNQGFDCLGDFVHAIWKASNGQRDSLKASLIEVTRQRDGWFENTERESDEVESLQLKLRQLQEKLDELQRQEPVAIKSLNEPV